MSELIISDIDATTLDLLRRQAAAHAQSVELEVKAILAGALQLPTVSRLSNGSEPQFLAQAKRLVDHGKIDAAIDIIFDQIDEMLLARQFERVDQILRDVECRGYSIDILLSLLTITLAAKRHLPSRPAFYDLVVSTLGERNELSDGVLIGLD